MVLLQNRHTLAVLQLTMYCARECGVMCDECSRKRENMAGIEAGLVVEEEDFVFPTSE